MDEFDDIEPSVALVPAKKPEALAKKKSNTELVLELAKSDGNNNGALIAVLEKMNQLETVNSAIKEVILAARDFEQNYTIPGNKRFKRVVRLRKALDELEERVKRGRL